MRTNIVLRMSLKIRSQWTSWYECPYTWNSRIPRDLEVVIRNLWHLKLENICIRCGIREEMWKLFGREIVSVEICMDGDLPLLLCFSFMFYGLRKLNQFLYLTRKNCTRGSSFYFFLVLLLLLLLVDLFFFLKRGTSLIFFAYISQGRKLKVAYWSLEWRTRAIPIFSSIAKVFLWIETREKSSSYCALLLLFDFSLSLCCYIHTHFSLQVCDEILVFFFGLVLVEYIVWPEMFRFGQIKHRTRERKCCFFSRKGTWNSNHPLSIYFAIKKKCIIGILQKTIYWSYCKLETNKVGRRTIWKVQYHKTCTSMQNYVRLLWFVFSNE